MLFGKLQIRHKKIRIREKNRITLDVMRQFEVTRGTALSVTDPLRNFNHSITVEDLAGRTIQCLHRLSLARQPITAKDIAVFLSLVVCNRSNVNEVYLQIKQVTEFTRAIDWRESDVLNPKMMSAPGDGISKVPPLGDANSSLNYPSIKEDCLASALLGKLDNILMN